jgi:hypothetical protein
MITGDHNLVNSADNHQPNQAANNNKLTKFHNVHFP